MAKIAVRWCRPPEAPLRPPTAGLLAACCPLVVQSEVACGSGPPPCGAAERRNRTNMPLNASTAVRPDPAPSPRRGWCPAHEAPRGTTPVRAQERSHEPIGAAVHPATSASSRLPLVRSRREFGVMGIREDTSSDPAGDGELVAALRWTTAHDLQVEQRFLTRRRTRWSHRAHSVERKR